MFSSEGWTSIGRITVLHWLEEILSEYNKWPAKRPRLPNVKGKDEIGPERNIIISLYVQTRRQYVVTDAVLLYFVMKSKLYVESLCRSINVTEGLAIYGWRQNYKCRPLHLFTTCAECASLTLRVQVSKCHGTASKSVMGSNASGAKQIVVRGRDRICK